MSSSKSLRIKDQEAILNQMRNFQIEAMKLIYDELKPKDYSEVQIRSEMFQQQLAGSTIYYYIEDLSLISFLKEVKVKDFSGIYEFIKTHGLNKSSVVIINNMRLDCFCEFSCCIYAPDSSNPICCNIKLSETHIIVTIIQDNKTENSYDVDSINILKPNKKFQN